MFIMHVKNRSQSNLYSNPILKIIRDVDACVCVCVCVCVYVCMAK